MKINLSVTEDGIFRYTKVNKIVMTLWLFVSVAYSIPRYYYRLNGSIHEGWFEHSSKFKRIFRFLKRIQQEKC